MKERNLPPPNASNHWGRARPTPGARDSSWISHVQAGADYFSICFPECTLAGSGSEEAAHGPGTLMYEAGVPGDVPSQTPAPDNGMFFSTNSK